jgi:hypothetical protein
MPLQTPSRWRTLSGVPPARNWTSTPSFVKKSPVCRPDSDCYDVELAFFNPNNTRVANRIYRFTVDVSDVIPVTIGAVRSWTRRCDRSESGQQCGLLAS